MKPPIKAIVLGRTARMKSLLSRLLKSPSLQSLLRSSLGLHRNEYLCPSDPMKVTCYKWVTGLIVYCDTGYSDSFDIT